MAKRDDAQPIERRYTTPRCDDKGWYVLQDASFGIIKRSDYTSEDEAWMALEALKESFLHSHH